MDTRAHVEKVRVFSRIISAMRYAAVARARAERALRFFLSCLVSGFGSSSWTLTSSMRNRVVSVGKMASMRRKVVGLPLQSVW